METSRGKMLVRLALQNKGATNSEAVSSNNFLKNSLPAAKRGDESIADINEESTSRTTFNLRQYKQLNYFTKNSDSSESMADSESGSDYENFICSDSVSSESHESDVLYLKETRLTKITNEHEHEHKRLPCSNFESGDKFATEGNENEVGLKNTEFEYEKVSTIDKFFTIGEYTADEMEMLMETDVLNGIDANIINENREIESPNAGIGNKSPVMVTGEALLYPENILHQLKDELRYVNDTEIDKNRKEALMNSSAKKNIDGIIVKFGKLVDEPIDNVEHFRNTRPWTKKTTCPYCFQEVTHFPRHLMRNHKQEGAVKELSSRSLKDPKRKDLLNLIRRQGNYIFNSQSNIIRPVRRPKDCDNTAIDKVEEGKDKYVACQDCLGFFKRQFLRRHRKTCRLRARNTEFPKRENHLTESQMFMICAGGYTEFYDSLRLKDEVFKIMRADERSKVAMNDVLICSYAESLLRKHKRTQIRTTVSNKMRELARLLIILKQMTGVQRLVDILKPEFFDNIISATKVISRYDPETRTFEASSLALHMGTTLKQVCDIATKLIIKKSRFLPCNEPEQSLKNIKRIRNLIDNHWNSEISSLALKNLNEKRWEQPKLFPLTSDVLHFQQYVMKEAKDACENVIQGNQIKKEYRKLSESVFALTLLLNRKRIGEIQYLKLQTYIADVSFNHQEEFLQSLSETEKLLTKNFKRVITGGKGSKPVAILFPKNIQKFISVMLSARQICVPQTNEYLFANPRTHNGWLSGYHALKKLACESGVKNQDLFTSTRLRKQIATVLQVMNITDTEMEQFAAFMGHTKKTHETYYRLPQDVYQTAKVSKLLLAINKGKGALYKGKTLDELEFSDNVGSDESDSETELHCTQQFHYANKTMDILKTNAAGFSRTANSSSDSQVHIHNDNNTGIDHKNAEDDCLSKHQDTTFKETKKGQKQKLKIERVKWTEQQKLAMSEFFRDYIKNKKAPKKHEVEKLMEQHKRLFKDKNWVKIKAYVYNCYKKI